MRRRDFLATAVAGGAFLGSSFLLTGCPSSRRADPWANAGTKPKILVSFAPLYSFASSVAGDDAAVKCLLTSSGVHTHGDATPDQIELARGCDAFVINGLGLEDEGDGIAGKLGQVAANPNWNVVNLGSKINTDWLREGACTHDHGHAHEEHEHPTDPHAWLSVRCAKVMVEGIRDELVRLDPTHADGYKTRSATYLEKLTKLEADGRKMLESKQNKWVLSFHEALGYFGETYGFRVAGSIQVTPGQEPSDATLQKLIKLCKDKQVRVIAVEPQFHKHTSARIIADALPDVRLAEVDPLETCDAADLSPALYETVMRRNLENLTAAMR